MKKLLIALLLLTACQTTPQFKQASYQPFGEKKYPPIILFVNSGSACSEGIYCSYSEKFLSKLRETGAFSYIDTNNPQASYRVKIHFYAGGINNDSLYARTAGWLPSDVKRHFRAVFEIENDYGMLKTYTYNLTGTRTKHVIMNDDYEDMVGGAIESMVAHFIASLQRDNVFPLQ